jgi:hypothetical protein
VPAAETRRLSVSEVVCTRRRTDQGSLSCLLVRKHRRTAHTAASKRAELAVTAALTSSAGNASPAARRAVRMAITAASVAMQTAPIAVAASKACIGVTSGIQRMSEPGMAGPAPLRPPARRTAGRRTRHRPGRRHPFPDAGRGHPPSHAQSSAGKQPTPNLAAAAQPGRPADTCRARQVYRRSNRPRRGSGKNITRPTRRRHRRHGHLSSPAPRPSSLTAEPWLLTHPW